MLIRLDNLTEQARLLVNSRLDALNSSLHQQINKAIHSHPETAYEEFFAHDTITKYLQDLGFQVTKHAYGLKTSFEASLGSGGRQVVFCAEYDALPGIGHGCGHNLIATASIGAFLGAAHALATLKIPGLAAYSNVSLLRQQIHPDERIHGVIEDGGTIPGVIPDYTRMHWNVRSPTMERGEKLLERVKACLEAGAAATGCQINYIFSPTYMDLRVNETLCKTYVQDMARLGQTVALNMAEPATASTDMGNVSYLVPSFHGAFTITSDPNVAIHSPKFAEAASADEAHATAMKTAKGMAMLAIRVLIEENIAHGARRDFETDK
ncbi:hypothetical protein CDV31_000837 [Fusarium ambrosium]|uniref:Peptidase M20 domain-containing protein 2 n=1 Tax=Fusarium ambrosium TaxID=131363 RepID=A0A428V1F4_9HYPO|nr:hypothetical protein CDV31_000837 [Fusarium ambrosium]